MPASNWNYPTAIRNGAGRSSELAQACREFGMSRPLLITDPGLADSAMLRKLLETCEQNGLAMPVFSGIKPNPTGVNVEAGVACYKAGQHDGVIAVGGGSALDAAKAVALMAGQNISIWDLEDVGDNWLRADPSAIAPVIAIPTTAGTGSEVGRASVIVDESAKLKKIIFHPRMVPVLVFLDAELTTGLPPALTAATGMDALSHSLEALCSPVYHPMAEGIAMQGIYLVDRWLRTAYRDGANLEAREQMLVASCMGATAFQRGLGAMHALAHPLGAIYDAHHGLLNAILMPYVLNANRAVIGDAMERLGRNLLLAKQSVDGVIEWVLQLRQDLDIPTTLQHIGIDDSAAADIGAMAAADPSAGTNPSQFSSTEYAEILVNAVHGRLD